MPATSRAFVKASIAYLGLGAVLGALLLINRWIPMGTAIAGLRVSHILHNVDKQVNELKLVVEAMDAFSQSARRLISKRLKIAVLLALVAKT